ncbi:MAG: HAD family hydrolase [Candidatus Lokiarchaeota archaeon]|nr:HAD family hydrolase [Candidatus Lokiarchaeota archaeon]
MLEKSSFYKKKIIVFDLDGTIVDLDVDWTYLKENLKKRYFKKYNEDCEFVSISECLNNIVKREDEIELLEIFKIVEDFEMKSINRTKPIDEIVSFIKNITDIPFLQEVNLSILSLNTRKTIKEVLKLFKIYKYFNLIVGKEDVRYWKPNPEGLLKIKSHFKVENQEIIYFGDKQKDLKTGKNANIDSFLINDLIDLIAKNLDFLQ